MFSRILLFLALCAAPLLLRAEDIPEFRLVQFASHIDMPVGMADDGAGRLYVLEQNGRIRLIRDGQLEPEPFLDIHERVSRAGNECGLLGITFHPDYKNNRRFFINYDTEKFGALQTCISEFKANAAGTRADPASEKILLRFDQPYTNHKGGCILFGPDRMLYIGQGDGGSGGDPQQHGQSLDTYLAKILRIDVDHGSPYSAPPDNPFVNRPGAKPEIWCYGLRNPWRFSFDRQTGQCWCADVGQDKWEEIDIIEKGKNYGWSAREGKHDFKPERAAGPLTEPIKDYGHGEGTSITGGYVYRGKAIPALNGMYVYADYTRGWVAGLRYDGRQVTFDAHLLQAPFNIASFGEDHDGELYLCDRENGRLYKLVP